MSFIEWNLLAKIDSTSNDEYSCNGYAYSKATVQQKKCECVAAITIKPATNGAVIRNEKKSAKHETLYIQHT